MVDGRAEGLELGIAEIQGLMACGALTAQALVEAFLERIDEVDRPAKRPPRAATNAIIETNPDAPSIARELDRERRDGRVRGPLHGIPVVLKDNIDTGDRMQTTAGSLALAGTPAAADASVVRRLRDAGAVVLAKANLSEWANFRSTRSTSGWSSRGGQTRNPYALDRSPCGSSSGSAVAVAAGLCVAAVGTETDGSIVCPASMCSVVGIKPTVGLVSRSGIVPIAHSQDTAGSMARTVADAAALLTAMAGPDASDPATAMLAGRAAEDYTRALDSQGLRGARIGVARRYFGFHPGVDELMERALATMREQGAVLVDPVGLDTRELWASEVEVLLYEFRADLDAYLSRREPRLPVGSLRELIAYNDAHRDTVMPWFGQERFLEAAEKGPLTDSAYLAALAQSRRVAREQGIDAVVERHRLEAIVAPTAGPAWLIDLVNGDHHGGGSSSPAAVAGYPSITVPAGYVHGLPVGISFFAGALAESTLIRLAYAFEQSTRARLPPRFAPTAELA